MGSMRTGGLGPRGSRATMDPCRATTAAARPRAAADARVHAPPPDRLGDRRTRPSTWARGHVRLVRAAAGRRRGAALRSPAAATTCGLDGRARVLRQEGLQPLRAALRAARRARARAPARAGRPDTGPGGSSAPRPRRGAWSPAARGAPPGVSVAREPRRLEQHHHEAGVARGVAVGVLGQTLGGLRLDPLHVHEQLRAGAAELLPALLVELQQGPRDVGVRMVEPARRRPKRGPARRSPAASSRRAPAWPSATPPPRPRPSAAGGAARGSGAGPRRARASRAAARSGRAGAACGRGRPRCRAARRATRPARWGSRSARPAWRGSGRAGDGSSP